MKIGSLFSGYGGLDMGVQAIFGGTIAWHSDIEPGPSRILAHHWPDVPNLGDITQIDWTDTERVDVITGGFPCQDVSHAGRRAGLIRDGEGRTRSGLWGEMLRAIGHHRPALVVAENVRGLLSARADSDLEPCPFCMGDDGDSPMRALGAVLADLADIGYDAAWCGLRAADVGAPHGRFRVFILAWPAADAAGARRAEGQDRRAGRGDAGARARRGEPQRVGREPLTLLPTPVADNSRGLAQPGSAYASLPNAVLSLLPTPRATDGTKGGPNQRGSSGDLMLPSAVQGLGWGPPCPTCGCGIDYHDGDGFCAGPCGGNAHDCGGRDLLLPTPRATRGGSATETTALLPTPSAARDGNSPESHLARKPGRTQVTSLDVVLNHPEAVDFGQYAPAIARWEHVLGRPAPSPTEPTGKAGARRLSPRFVEWLMGLPAGHVTDVPDLSRNAQLKALGNGVVPQQAEAALRWLLHIRQTALTQEAA